MVFRGLKRNRKKLSNQPEECHLSPSHLRKNKLSIFALWDSGACLKHPYSHLIIEVSFNDILIQEGVRQQVATFIGQYPNAFLCYLLIYNLYFLFLCNL